MKKKLLLAGAMFFTITSVGFPMLGFYFLEPSMVNLLFICWFFAMSVASSFYFTTEWLKERRNDMMKASIYAKLEKKPVIAKKINPENI